MLTGYRLFIIGIALILVLAVGCASGEQDPFPTAVPAATSTPVPAADDGSVDDDDEGHEADSDSTVDSITRGRAVYQQIGCAACHGEDASGTVIAPGLPGHNELQVRRQVRGPIGVMPVFGRETLDGEDLTDLVAYVESLGGGHAHGDAGGAPLAEQSLSHHRMALTAFEAENIDEAQHHIEHLLGILEGQHLSLMQEALDLTLAGEIHDAQHMVEGMLSDVQPPYESFASLHLKLGLSGLRIAGTDEAMHHLAHAATVAAGDELAEINEILLLLTAGEPHEAEERLSELLNLDSIGVEDHEGMEGMEGMDDDAADAHEDDGDDHAADDDADDHSEPAT